MGSNRKNSGEWRELSGCLGRGKGWRSLDTCLWCSRSMIPDSGIMLWSVQCLHVDRFVVLMTVSRSFNIMFLPFGKRFFKTQILSNTNFFARLFAYPTALRRAKNIPVICCKKKKKHSKYGAFLTLSCDKLRSHLQSDWPINRCSKGTVL